MKYKIHIESSTNQCLVSASQYFVQDLIVEACDRCEAVGIAMRESNEAKIEVAYLPLTITIEEA